MFRTNRWVITTATFSIAAAAACSDDTPLVPVGPALVNTYTGPGSYYENRFYDDDTFVMDVSETTPTIDASATDNQGVGGVGDSVRVEGTTVSVPTGYTRLDVTTVTPPNDDIKPGDKIYSLEIPGFTFVMAPPDGQMIPMMVAGQCPSATATVEANFMVAQDDTGESAQSATAGWWGTVEFKAAESTADVTQNNNLTNFAETGELPPSVTSVTCDPATGRGQGTWETTTPPATGTANVWFTSMGGLMIESLDAAGEKIQTRAALPTPSAPVNVSALAGNYSAISVDATGSEPTYLDIGMEANGTGAAQEYLDPDTGTLEPGDPAIVTFTETESDDGWFTGTLAMGTDMVNLACSAGLPASPGGKTILFCVGQSPENPAEPMAIVMVTKPEPP